MKILIIGGSHFLGRHLAEAALAQGHQLTLFNRGKTHSHLFPAVEEIHGDRYHDLPLLVGKTWDAVIDTCGYHPAAVGCSALMLKHVADRYVFISSISVYKDFSIPRLNETSPTCDWPEETDPKDNTPSTYGARKILCELAVEASFRGRALHIRPGVLAGPYDSSGRVPYWLYRLARGGEVLAPGNPDHPLQLLDARDLASWTVRMIESKQTGIFNAVGPDGHLTFQEFLQTCQIAVCSTCSFKWASEELLFKHGVKAWTELPLWIPEFLRGLHEVKGMKAFGQGLNCRPLEMTLEDTWRWQKETKPTYSDKPWLTQEQEAKLLTAIPRAG